MEAAAAYPAYGWKWLDQWGNVEEIGHKRIAWGTGRGDQSGAGWGEIAAEPTLL